MNILKTTGGRGVHVWERMYTHGGFMSMYGKTNTELYKKGLNDPDNHNGVVTQLKSDILECEVKWGLRKHYCKQS